VRAFYRNLILEGRTVQRIFGALVGAKGKDGEVLFVHKFRIKKTLKSLENNKRV